MKAESGQGETDSLEEVNKPPRNQVIINTKIKFLSPWRWCIVKYWTEFKWRKGWKRLLFTLLISIGAVWVYYILNFYFFDAIKCFFQKGKMYLKVNRRWILAVTCKTDLTKWNTFVVLGMTSKIQKHIRIIKLRRLN